MEPNSADTVACPTCRAVQPWSDSCRRCKCDLRLLREADEAYRALHRQCLGSLRDNRPAAALEYARQCFALRADGATLRLLAVCEFLGGDWNAARSLAERAIASN